MNRKLIFLLLMGNAINIVRPDFELNIVHLNDIHSHFQETKEYDEFCTPEDSQQGLCYGGIARQVTKIKEIREKEKNVLVLSAGDFFMGRSFNPLHGFRLASVLLPYLELNATALGNHVFDNGALDASAFILTLKCPVVCCNLVGRKNSFWEKFVNKSTILNVSGEKIGIIGFIHPNTAMWARTGVSLHFTDELPCLQQEVKRLQTLGVNKIIALGHSGFEIDKKIAHGVPGVDVVVGGNSQLFLYNQDDLTPGGKPHLLTPFGIYPKVVHQLPPDEIRNISGSKFLKADFSLVVQVPQHGKYLGHLKVIFNDKGRIVNFTGNPILLDNSVPKDSATEEELEKSVKILEHPKKQFKHIPSLKVVLGKSSINLAGGLICRMMECSLGNLITDAMLHAFERKNKQHGDLDGWFAPDAAVWNAGALRSSLRAGNITMKNLVRAVFLGDMVEVLDMTGHELKKMLENSVADYDVKGITPPGAFLQMSGMRVTYDLSKPQHQRVKNIKIRCRSCEGNRFEPVDEHRTYRIAMPQYIKRGGDGYQKFPTKSLEKVIADIHILADYLQENSPISTSIEERIDFEQDVKDVLRKLNFGLLKFFHPPSNEHDVHKANVTRRAGTSAFDSPMLNLVASQMSNSTSINGNNSSLYNELAKGENSSITRDKEENNQWLLHDGDDVFVWRSSKDHPGNETKNDIQVPSGEFLKKIFEDDALVKKTSDPGSTLTGIAAQNSTDANIKEKREVGSKSFHGHYPHILSVRKRFRHKTIKKDLSALNHNIFTLREEIVQDWPDILMPEMLKPTKPLAANSSTTNNTTLFNSSTPNELDVLQKKSFTPDNSLEEGSKSQIHAIPPVNLTDVPPPFVRGKNVTENSFRNDYSRSKRNEKEFSVHTMANSPMSTEFTITSRLSNENPINNASIADNIMTLSNPMSNSKNDDKNITISTNSLEPIVFALILNEAEDLVDNSNKSIEIHNLEVTSNLIEDMNKSQNSGIINKINQAASEQKRSLNRDIILNENQPKINLLNKIEDNDASTNVWSVEITPVLNKTDNLSIINLNKKETPVPKVLSLKDKMKQEMKELSKTGHDEITVKKWISPESESSTNRALNILDTVMENLETVENADISLQYLVENATKTSEFSYLHTNKDNETSTKNQDHLNTAETTAILNITSSIFSLSSNNFSEVVPVIIDHSTNYSENNVTVVPTKVNNSYKVHVQRENNPSPFGLIPESPSPEEKRSTFLPRSGFANVDHVRKQDVTSMPHIIHASSEIHPQQKNNSPTFDKDFVNSSKESTVTTIKPKPLFANIDHSKKDSEGDAASVSYKIHDFSGMNLQYKNNSSAIDPILQMESTETTIQAKLVFTNINDSGKHSEDVITSMPHKILATFEPNRAHESSKINSIHEDNADNSKKHSEEIVISVPIQVNPQNGNHSSTFHVIPSNSSTKGIESDAHIKHIPESFNNNHSEESATSISSNINNSFEINLQHKNYSLDLVSANSFTRNIDDGLAAQLLITISALKSHPEKNISSEQQKFNNLSEVDLSKKNGSSLHGFVTVNQLEHMNQSVSSYIFNTVVDSKTLTNEVEVFTKSNNSFEDNRPHKNVPIVIPENSSTEGLDVHVTKQISFEDLRGSSVEHISSVVPSVNTSNIKPQLLNKASASSEVSQESSTESKESSPSPKPVHIAVDKLKNSTNNNLEGNLQQESDLSVSSVPSEKPSSHVGDTAATSERRNPTEESTGPPRVKRGMTPWDFLRLAFWKTL